MRNHRPNNGSRATRGLRLRTIGWCVATSLLSGIATQLAWAGDIGIATAPMQVQSMHRLTANSGWAAGPANVLRTKDGGRRWTDITPTAKDSGSIESVFFLDDRHGWVASSITETTYRSTATFRIFSTSDGGSSWISRSSALPGTEGGVPTSIDFVDAQHGWAMLTLPSSSNFSRAAVLATANGGISWTTLPQPPMSGEMKFISSSTGWLAGGPASDALYVTRDGGQSWQRQTVSPPRGASKAGAPIYQLPTFHNDHDGELAVFFGGTGMSQLAVYDTHDAGTTWNERKSVLLSEETNGAGGVVAALVDADTVLVAPRSREGFAALEQGVQSNDSRVFDQLSADEAVTAMDFTDARQGWILVANGHCEDGKSRCRQQGRLFATGDGGRSLSEVTPSIAANETALAGGMDPKLVVNSTGKGFDKCAAGSVSQMQAWWTNTPWSYANIYIGGSNRGCSQGNLTSGWITSILNQGWRLIPTWVGPQAPGSSCTSCGKMSSNTTTARQQGINEANAASDAAAALGLNPPTVIYYDMERYDPTSNAAARAFVDGWVARMHQRGNTAGVYGAGVNAANDWALIANPPNAVWIAAWNGNTSVFGLSGLPDGYWTTHQRLHQYQGGHNETWGGVTFNIDSDSADGPVADR
jgi:photosystem II stability/assembly factor-like uncharacterized protein